MTSVDASDDGDEPKSGKIDRDRATSLANNLSSIADSARDFMAMNPAKGRRSVLEPYTKELDTFLACHYSLDQCAKWLKELGVQATKQSISAWYKRRGVNVEKHNPRRVAKKEFSATASVDASSGQVQSSDIAANMKAPSLSAQAKGTDSGEALLGGPQIGGEGVDDEGAQPWLKDEVKRYKL